MTQYEHVFRDLQEILRTVPGINYVEVGKPTPIALESTFTAAYVLPDTTTFTLDTGGTTRLDGYTTKAYIRVYLNMNNQGPEREYEWVRTQYAVIRGVLQDSEIWSGIVDRDVISVTYDDQVSAPLVALEILFEFKIRESCEV